MNEIAVDYGRKRVGVAVNLRGVVIPLPTLEGLSWTALSGRLKDIQRENGSGPVILGLPLTGQGRETELCGEVRKFAAFLMERGFDVKLIRETGTTLEARQGSGNRCGGNLDSLAASVILKRYLGSS